MSEVRSACALCIEKNERDDQALLPQVPRVAHSENVEPLRRKEISSFFGAFSLKRGGQIDCVFSHLKNRLKR